MEDAGEQLAASEIQDGWRRGTRGGARRRRRPEVLVAVAVIIDEGGGRRPARDAGSTARRPFELDEAQRPLETEFGQGKCSSTTGDWVNGSDLTPRRR